MDLEMMFTLEAAAIIWKLPTEKVVVQLLLSRFMGKAMQEWVNMVQNDYCGRIGQEEVLYPLPTLN